MNLDRADLELLLAIEQGGSLAQAAQALHLAAPAVTKRLAALESRLQTKLFWRTTRRMAATAEGELLCERAGTLLAQFAQLEGELLDAAREPAGPIKLAATLGFGRVWLGPALAQFQKKHPKVRVDLQLTETLPELGAAGLDAAVWLWAPSANRAGQWQAKVLARNERVLVAAPAYLRARGAPKSIEALAEHECLFVRESSMTANMWHLTHGKPGSKAPTVSVRVTGPLSSNSGELVRDWCLGGHGIMLRSLWDAAPLLASGALVRVLPQAAMRDADVHWLAPFRAQVPKRVQLLREFLAAHFKTRPWEIKP